IPLPAVWLWSIFFWRRLSVLYHRWWRAGARVLEPFGETLSGVRITKALTREAREGYRFGLYNPRLLDVDRTTRPHPARLVATMTLISGLGVLSVWLVGSWKVLHQQISLGTLLAFYGYIVLFYGPVQWFGQVTTWMTQAFTGAQRIFEILDMQAEDD